MTRRSSGIFALLALIALLAPPAAAGLLSTSVSLTPYAPLVPGGQQQVVAGYALIPAGSTTFARGHELQMQTGLSEAQWSIQVTLDGRNAAQQNAKGNTAFVNGEILSYPTNHDVGMIVTINGVVPQDATDPFTVLQIIEIDNSGNAVPGTTITLTQPVAGTASPLPTSAIPTLTSPLPTTTTPKATPGFGLPVLLSAFFVAGLLIGISRQR